MSAIVSHLWNFELIIIPPTITHFAPQTLQLKRAFEQLHFTLCTHYYYLCGISCHCQWYSSLNRSILLTLPGMDGGILCK